MMRVDKELLAQLRARKQVARESYADVVARMIRNEVNPNPIQKMLREKHGVENCSFCGKQKRIGSPCSCKFGGVFG